MSDRSPSDSRAPSGAPTQPKLPMQPVHKAADGVIRFVPNRIVRDLLDFATPRGMGMNELAMRGDAYTDAEREQFAQLIGYSIGGYSELSYVSEASYKKASKRAALAGRLYPHPDGLR